MTDQFAITQKAVVLGPAPDRRVLLLENPQGRWELPGGPLRPGEEAAAGLRRAVSERVGLDVDVKRPVHTTAWDLDDGSGAFAAVYRAKAPTEQATLAGEDRTAVWTDARQALESKELTDAQRTAITRANQP